MIRAASVSLALSVMLAVAVTTLAPAGAEAAMTEQDVRTSIEKTYDVRVLKLAKGRMNGKDVYFVTVMSEGGNDNAAFQVNRLAVDVETGRLVSRFHHGANGYDPAPGAGEREPNRQPTDVLRRGWNWR